MNDRPDKTHLELLFADLCPDCGGELDTGFECIDCERDWCPVVFDNIGLVRPTVPRGPSGSGVRRRS